VLGKDFVLSFQEDASRDVFNPVRDRLRSGNVRLREGTSDYLCYSLIDVIVDSYFGIIDKINDRIEQLEDLILLNKNIDYFSSISIMRREVMLLRRSIGPVRELVNGFLRSDNKLLDDKHDKFYKDVSDHILQANDYVEAHREMLMNLQDLYMNQVNLRMNEVMKIFTMVALLLAPATVIGGIFGMNFEVIPFQHQKIGFYVSVGLMFIIPVIMLIYFKKKGWF
jgi:magnesium transporter